MADFMDLIAANVVGNWISNPRSERDDEAARTRARSIQDNFGLKPIDIQNFRRQNGGTGLLKGFGIAAVITAIGGALAFTPLGLTALVVGAIIGSAAAILSVSKQGTKIKNGYNSYLDTVAAVGREARDKSISVEKTVEPGDNTPAKSHTAEVAASREQAAATGATR